MFVLLTRGVWLITTHGCILDGVRLASDGNLGDILALVVFFDRSCALSRQAAIFLLHVHLSWRVGTGHLGDQGYRSLILVELQLPRRSTSPVCGKRGRVC